jgi:hypothetical protein
MGILRPPSRSFETLRAAGSAYDGSLAAGARHLLAMGNYGVAIYAKDGGSPIVQCDLRGWFPNAPAGVEAFDPRALYDQHEQRWIVLALAKVGPIPPASSWLLLSVSRTADPLGEWWSWVFDAEIEGAIPSGLWADYPCIGIDDRAVYVTLNMFPKTGLDSYAKLRIFPKSELYQGRMAAYMDFIKLENPAVRDSKEGLAFAIQPSHTYGAPGVEYCVNTLSEGGDTLTLWHVTGSLGAPAIACDPVKVDPYLYPSDGAPQMGDTTPLGVGGARVRSAVYRDGSVWVAFATGYGQARGGPALTSARWYEIAGGKAVRNGEVAAADTHYSFPSVMPDRQRRVTMVVSRSSATEFPSLHYAVWGPTGGGTATLLKPGEGPHVKCRQGRPCNPPRVLSGWGDYNTAALDPTDESTVWLYGGAGAKNDKTSWAMWVSAVT